LTNLVRNWTSCDEPVERHVGTLGRVHPHVEIEIVMETVR
jgi:hypothetical protein